MNDNGYIATLNEDRVERSHVSFRTRYGMTIAGDLYTAKRMDRAEKHPALIVGAPYGGVKEQGPCVYAGELAQRGFVVLTFDQAFINGHLLPKQTASLAKAGPVIFWVLLGPAGLRGVISLQLNLALAEQIAFEIKQQRAYALSAVINGQHIAFFVHAGVLVVSVGRL